MNLNWFSPPVPIKARVGLTLNVSNVQAAGTELLRFTEKGRHWRRAVECVVAFGEGQASVTDVRRTFRLAAKEKGGLMPE